MSRVVLRTVDQVIEALGDGDKQAGRRELLRITGRRTQHVTNWLAEGRIPKVFWIVVSKALDRRGHSARPELFGIAPTISQAKAS